MAGSSGRGTRGQPLGRCPGCGEMIPSANLLIRYETAEGWPKLLAQCDDCEDPVYPE